MSIITMDAAMRFSAFRPGFRRYDYQEVSDPTGAVADRPQGQPRWSLVIESPDRMTRTQANIWLQTLLKLNGRENHFAAWDYVRAAPTGTMRGTMTLLNAVAQGDVSCIVTAGAGQAGRTLEPIDFLQFGAGLGSQRIAVADSATANGSGQITINFKFPARVDFAAGTAVTWDKPVTHYKMITEDPGWAYDPGFFDSTSKISIEFLEQWQ